MTHAHRPSASRMRGFSFLELIVVMAIAAVLVGGVLVAVKLSMEKGPEFQTRVTLSKARFLVEDWERTFETLPPASLERLHRLKVESATARGDDRLDAPNATNDSIETVHRAAFVPGFRGRADFSEEQRSNTDRDSVGARPLVEIKDGHGHPVIYIPNGVYRRAAKHGLAYVNGQGEEVIAYPHRAADGTYERPASFQIYSMGADGQPNTPDDVLGWER